MAFTDKNLVITPSVGSSGEDPKIVFSGADSSLGPQSLTARIYPSSNGTLSFEGSSGQLFSITNSLTGTIYSVNDASGLPSIEVFEDGVIRLARYSGRVVIGDAVDNGVDSIQFAGNTSFQFASLNANGTFTSTGQMVSLLANGTAPLVVQSSTLVANLNADLLDGQQGSYYLDWTNTTNKPDPKITVTLTGDVTGSANTTLTDLADGTISIATTVVSNAITLGTDTTGNYVATIGGTTNQVTVTGSGSESAAVTLSLPQNIHTAATPTFGSLTITNGVVINEGGGDNDTRIEGDTDENLLFVNAGADRVGIGRQTPQGKFGVLRAGGAETLSYAGVTIDVDTTITDQVETLTAFKSNYGIYSALENNAKTSGNFDHSVHGLYGVLNKYGGHSTTGYGNDYGVFGRVNIYEGNNAGYKNIDTVNGVQGGVVQYAANTNIQSIRGVTASASIVDAANTTVTNLIGVYSDVRPMGANVSITNSAMFWGSWGAGTPTANVQNNYGIYINSSVNHYLRGSIKLGSSGNAPTGNTASSVTLELSEVDSATLRLTSTDTTGALDQMIGQIQFYGSDGDLPGAGVKSKIASYMTPAAGDGSYLTFSTSDGVTNDIERVRILSSGNVGIATNAPDEKLHIIGNTKANTFISTVTSGTAPFTVASNTAVTNLNADLLDGQHGSYYTNASNLSTGTVPGDRGVTAGSTSSSFVEYNGTTSTAGQFDGGTSTPSGTTRLNYGGYLYATRFYGDGNNLTAIKSGDQTFTVYNYTASASGNSQIAFSNKDGASADRIVAKILGETTDNGGNGKLTFYTAFGVTLYKGFELDAGSNIALYNTSSVQKFKWDASNESVNVDKIISYAGAAATTQLFGNVTTGTVTIAGGLTTGTLNLGASAVGAKTVNIGTSTGATIINGSLTINESSADVDVRIEGNNDVNLFFTDGDTDRVGIGTSTPNNKLDVIYNSTETSLTANAGTGVTAGLRINNANTTANTYAYIDLRAGSSDVRLASVTKGSNLSDFVILNDNGDTTIDEQFRITSDGAVGIGTSTPGTKLAVAGLITELYNSTYWNVVSQADIGTDPNQVPLNQYLGQLAFADEYSPSGLRRTGAGSNDVSVDSNGNVGIGTASPGTLLHIYGATDPTIKIQSDSADEISGRLSLRQSNDTGADILYDGTNAVESLVVKTYTGGTFTADGMRISLAGNVTLPQNLTVNGSVVINEDSTDVDVRIEGNGDANLFFTDGGNDRVGIGTNAPGAKLDVRGSVIINEDSADVDVRIEGNNDVNLFFTDGGNDRVGIGTNAPSQKLDVNGVTKSNGYWIDNISYLDTATSTTTSISQIAHISFSTSSFGSGEITIQATSGVNRHLTKLLVSHDDTTAYATEYGVIKTGASLFTCDVDINSGNVRILITPASTTSTVFKSSYTLIAA